jgi:hypothetical protein
VMILRRVLLLIYFVETLASLILKSRIANESFYKMQYGPVPASFQAITDEMIEANELDRVRGRYFTYKQTKYYHVSQLLA